MNKLWIKLTCDFAGHKKDERVEVEETIARAYIAAGKAVEDKAATDDILAVARSEYEKALNDLKSSMATQQQEIARTLNEAKNALRPTPFTAPSALEFDGVLIATDSEDEKKLRSGGGFRSLGHFAHTLVRSNHPSNPDSRALEVFRSYTGLVERIFEHRNNQARALGALDGMYENSDPDGGALVAPTFSNKIWERVYEQANLLQYLDGYTIAGNSLRMPKNSETSRADGSRWGGTLGYWEGETQQFTGSRPKFDWADLRLKKLTVLTYTSNELLTDAGIALDQYLNKKAGDEITWKINNSLINGDGAGQPQGVLNYPGLITVAKDTGQAAKTISFTNVLNMWNAMWAPCRSRAVWVYNQECEPQFDQMVLPVGTGGVPVFQNGGSIFSAAKEGSTMMLKGRPMLSLEQCPGLGLVGDLQLIDLSQTLAIMKGGVQSSMSIHLKFDYDESVFKWIFRMDAQNAWTKALTPANTNTGKTYGPAVVLAAR
ncbi:MAG: phage major capsid protein, partial [Cyanobacteria bacterium REEB65]|nr:phage major capsid protein [Cyanobacteria bacterium REEB65]